MPVGHREQREVVGLRIAVLVKQIPALEEMFLGPDGRLVRDGIELEMSAYCRRAVSKAVELAADLPQSTVTVFTLGPPAAEDVLREAIAWGLERRVEIAGVLVSDREFAGSDTIATAKALAAVLSKHGPFDLVLAGRNSLDADTGQVPPQIAELLDLPFVAGVKVFAFDGHTLTLGCEHDDGWLDAEVCVPAVLTCAERLCEPAKVSREGRDAVAADLIRTVTASELGPGPWGAAASLTVVGDTEQLSVQRDRVVSPDASIEDQVAQAVEILLDRGALSGSPTHDSPPIATTGGSGPVVAVVAEPDRDSVTRELCGAAARLASSLSGSTVLLAPQELSAEDAGSWGADCLLRLDGVLTEEDVAGAVASWAKSEKPWAIIAGSTAYGREVASRVAIAAEAGLTGDAVDLEVVDGRLVAWKPAFGGLLVAAITATSPIQMATVRAGVLSPPRPRAQVAETSTFEAKGRRRVAVRLRRQDDALERLSEADAVIGVGTGVAPEHLHELSALRELLDAEIGCTRKVTDRGWMPHACQIGITGRSISPRLFISIGASGKFNHMVGVRSAGTELGQEARARIRVGHRCSDSVKER